MDNVQVEKVILENNLYYDKVLLLKYKIDYPQFYSNSCQRQLYGINKYYKEKALEMQNIYIRKYFDIAVAYYKYSKKSGFPIRLFEIYYTSTITYNENCTISLYYDYFVYLGGAHGSTTRSSETWDILKGDEITLCNLFNNRVNFNEYIIQSIFADIEQKNKKNPNMYFENYEKNVALTFNRNNFYLNSDGIIVVYFQQYSIAPYAAGIPEFIIPYEPETIIKPKCN